MYWASLLLVVALPVIVSCSESPLADLLTDSGKDVTAKSEALDRIVKLLTDANKGVSDASEAGENLISSIPSKISVPFCEPYATDAESGFGIELINLTTAMRLISTHRNNFASQRAASEVKADSNETDTNANESEDASNSTTAALTPLEFPLVGPTRGRCVAIYLFARWCSFSAAVAPVISALAKRFSPCCMKFVAVDAANDISGIATFFVAGSVPQLIIYRPHRPVVRISPISTDLALLIELVNNATGFNVTIANHTMAPDEEDYTDNVLPVTPIREFDPYLVVSWMHTILTLIIIAYKFEYVRNLILSIWTYLRGFGQEIHAHLE